MFDKAPARENEGNRSEGERSGILEPSRLASLELSQLKSDGVDTPEVADTLEIRHSREGSPARETNEQDNESNESNESENLDDMPSNSDDFSSIDEEEDAFSEVEDEDGEPDVLVGDNDVEYPATIESGQLVQSNLSVSRDQPLEEENSSSNRVDAMEHNEQNDAQCYSGQDFPDEKSDDDEGTEQLEFSARDDEAENDGDDEDDFESEDDYEEGYEDGENEEYGPDFVSNNEYNQYHGSGIPQAENSNEVIDLCDSDDEEATQPSSVAMEPVLDDPNNYDTDMRFEPDDDGHGPLGNNIADSYNPLEHGFGQINTANLQYPLLPASESSGQDAPVFDDSAGPYFAQAQMEQTGLEQLNSDSHGYLGQGRVGLLREDMGQIEPELMVQDSLEQQEIYRESVSQETTVQETIIQTSIVHESIIQDSIGEEPGIQDHPKDDQLKEDVQIDQREQGSSSEKHELEEAVEPVDEREPRDNSPQDQGPSNFPENTMSETATLAKDKVAEQIKTGASQQAVSEHDSAPEASHSSSSPASIQSIERAAQPVLETPLSASDSTSDSQHSPRSQSAAATPADVDDDLEVDAPDASPEIAPSNGGDENTNNRPSAHEADVVDANGERELPASEEDDLQLPPSTEKGGAIQHDYVDLKSLGSSFVRPTTGPSNEVLAQNLASEGIEAPSSPVSQQHDE